MDKNQNNYQHCGGFVISPDTIMFDRQRKKIAPGTKLVYMILRHLHRVSLMTGKPFSPSYTFMKKRFGISSATYHTALKQLNAIHAIHSSVTCWVPNGKFYLNVLMFDIDFETFEKIPNVILTTTLLTNQQKLFLCFLFKYFYASETEPGRLTTIFSSTEIAKRLDQLGISRRSAMTYLKQLSDPESGYITLLQKKQDYSYQLDLKVLQSIYDFELYYKETNINYQKPRPFDYTLNKETGRIIKNLHV